MPEQQMPMGFTQLSPVQQLAFLQWYQNMAKMTGNHPDPYAPGHHYDYAAAYLSGAQPDPAQGMHWPSQFKMAGHPNRFVPQPGGVTLDTITNQRLGDIRKP